MINRILRVLALSVIGLAMINATMYSSSLLSRYTTSFDKDIIKEYAEYTPPLLSDRSNIYCSSSIVEYKGHVVTVTNNHCCEASKGMFVNDKVLVGLYFEDIIYTSPVADICILTSEYESSPIKLAKKPFEFLDEALLLGYPRGEYLSPRFGYVVKKNSVECVGYDSLADYGGERCVDSNLLNNISYPGNSGSPVFNTKGEIVNVLYAGNPYVPTMSVTVPYVFLRAALEAAVKYDYD